MKRWFDEKRLFRYRAKVELIVASLDQTVGFSDDQRRQLVELILRETELPKRFGQYDYWLVMYQTGKIPESKLKTIFDDKQWAIREPTAQPDAEGWNSSSETTECFPKKKLRAFVGGFIDALKNARPESENEAHDPADVFATRRHVAGQEHRAATGCISEITR